MVVGSSREGEGESDAARQRRRRACTSPVRRLVHSPLSYLCAPYWAPLLRCAYGHPSLPPCCFGCPAPRKHVSQLREKTSTSQPASSWAACGGSVANENERSPRRRAGGGRGPRIKSWCRLLSFVFRFVLNSSGYPAVRAGADYRDPAVPNRANHTRTIHS